MSVKSAERVLRVFELLARHPEGLTVKEISSSLAFPQSSTFNLVTTLHEEGYVNQDQLKRYKLGPKLIQIGTAAMDSLDISAEGKPYLKKLMKDVQETVFMALLSDGELIYVVKIDNNRSIRTTAQLGKRKPLYCTGLGKAFLAFLPLERRKELLQGIELVPITDSTITNKEMLEQNLDSFVESGYSIDDEENEEGLFCLAAPVYGASGIMEAAISVAGPKERMLKHKNMIVEKLLSTSKKISGIAGYTGEKE